MLVVGASWRRSRPGFGIAYAVLVVLPAYVVGDVVWQLPHANLALACGATFSSVVATSFLKRDWNPPAQAFLGTSALTCFMFVLFAAEFTLSGNVPRLAYPISLLLIALEFFSFALLLMSAHEVLDVVCRVRWRRRTEGVDRRGGTPFVSIHVPTHNEPAELVLETLRALRRLDYPAYEVLVVDNNTADEALWRPVERYCEEIGFRFVHLDNWPGFKAGALNEALRVLDERTEIIAVVDADFVVDAEFLSRTVGYFADPEIAIVQTAQAFRTEGGSRYLRRLDMSYRAFDEVTLPSRNERNAIIFAGTMGLIRRRALLEAGGWGEWCVTEDAEVSLRILARGHKAIYVERSFGRGVMPLTFAALKKQRFRWCFGGVQILRRHWKLLIVGKGTAHDGAELRLTRGQRYDYLTASLLWFQAVVTLVFSAFLVIGVLSKAFGSGFALRPLVGFFVAVPALLLGSALLKSVWGLRARLHVGWGDALTVVGIWFALTWAVALGCIQGLTRREGAFLRTPKFEQRDTVRQALRATTVETALALVLTGAAFLAAASGNGFGAFFLAALCLWSALVFASAPMTAFAASRLEVSSPALRMRRRLESLNPRVPIAERPRRYALAVIGALAFFAITATSLSVAPAQSDLAGIFALPHRLASGSTGTDGGASDRATNAFSAESGASGIATLILSAKSKAALRQPKQAHGSAAEPRSTPAGDRPRRGGASPRPRPVGPIQTPAQPPVTPTPTPAPTQPPQRPTFTPAPAQPTVTPTPTPAPAQPPSPVQPPKPEPPIPGEPPTPAQPPGRR